jgi:hypothetical protein
MFEDEDIEVMLERGRVREVSRDYIVAWCMVFCVLGILKKRRRLITALKITFTNKGERSTRAS